MSRAPHITIALLLGAAACDEIPDSETGGGGAGAGSGASSGAGGDPFVDGTIVDVPTEPGPAFVDLDGGAIVDEAAAWELELDGLNVLTNGGASGTGSAKAFGPLDDVVFLGDAVPSDVPFLVTDQPGGAFLEWYAYDGTDHTLYSRYHVVGVRRGADTYKVQILGYYGEVQGAPVGGLYQMRSARVTPSGVEATVLWENIDGTAGGTGPTEEDPRGCVVLATGERLLLTPAEAAARDDWDLCFRRDKISVNGGDGGPGAVEGVDLQAGATAGESLEEVMQRTATSELATFDAVDDAALSVPALNWAGDGIVSAFTGEWIDRSVDPPVPVRATWLVAGADGETPFFVAFESFIGATATSAGTVRLRVKKLTGSLP